MDAKLSVSVRIAALLFVPVALVLLLPIVLLFVVGYYGFVVVQCIQAAIDVMRGRPDDTEPALQRPHFLDAPMSAPAQPDKLTDSERR